MDDAASEWGITYPHVNDVDLETWGAYGLTAHPSYALINPDGSLHDSGAGIVDTSGTREWIESHISLEAD